MFTPIEPPPILETRQQIAKNGVQRAPEVVLTPQSQSQPLPVRRIPPVKPPQSRPQQPPPMVVGSVKTSPSKPLPQATVRRPIPQRPIPLAKPPQSRPQEPPPPMVADSVKIPSSKPPPQATAQRPIPQNPVIVDSYAEPHVHPLSEWQARRGIFGFIDTVQIEGAQPRTYNWTPVNNNNVLVITGWAGVKEFGMQMTHVLLSVCDNVVGSVKVDSSRPDIAEQIHPNLLRAGWSARLAVNHLPRCANARINAWGLGRRGAVIWPVSREVKLTFDDSVPPKVKFSPNSSPLRAGNRPSYTRRRIQITARMLNLRRCGNRNCKVVAKLKTGNYMGLILQRKKLWSLVALQENAGWLANRYFKVSSLSRPNQAPLPPNRAQGEIGGYIVQGP